MSRLFAVFGLCSYLFSTAHGSWIQATYFSEPDSCSGAVAAQAFLPMNKCIAIPALPPSVNVTIPFKSIKSTCTQNADGSISTSNKVYASSSTCGGLGVPLNEDIPSGCQDGATFECVDDISSSPALANNWPAIGAYFDDSTCSSFDLLAAMPLDLCSSLTDGDGNSYSAVIHEEGSSFNAQEFDGVTDCSGTSAKEITIDEDVCSIVSYDLISTLTDRQNKKRAWFLDKSYENIAILFNQVYSSVQNVDRALFEVDQQPLKGSGPIYVYATHASNIK